MLLNESYKSSPYSPMTITDKSSGKKRDIMRPKFYPDQCVQWAIMQVVEPIIMKGHYYLSCGSVPRKGGHFAKRFVEKWIRKDPKNTKYTLQIDVTKFYPSINHDKLKEMFARKIKCKRTLNLIGEVIDGGGQGLPIGNYTSQWFANFYLQDFDHYLKEVLKIKYYVRYMDDIVIFGSNKRTLHKHFRIIEEMLHDLYLKPKGNWQVFRTDKRPLDFLGYKFYRNKTILRKKNSLRMKRRAKKIFKKGRLSFTDCCAMISYMGWIKSSNSYNFYNKHIKPYINIGKCKEVIRHEAKQRYQTQYC